MPKLQQRLPSYCLHRASGLAVVCGGVQVALADGGTVKGAAKWEGKPYKQKPLPQVEGVDPHCTKMHRK